MKKRLMLFFSILISSIALSDTVSDLSLTDRVDRATIAIDHNLLDPEAIGRAVQVGQDLSLIDAGTNGWVIVVSNIVHVGDAHIPGTLFVGRTIYGAPDHGYVLMTGAPFLYDRQIPGESGGSTNGIGQLVNEPWFDIWKRRFETDYSDSTNAMWGAINTLVGASFDPSLVESPGYQLRTVVDGACRNRSVNYFNQPLSAVTPTFPARAYPSQARDFFVVIRMGSTARSVTWPSGTYYSASSPWGTMAANSVTVFHFTEIWNGAFLVERFNTSSF